MLLLVIAGLAAGFAPAPFSRRGSRKVNLPNIQGTWVMTEGHVDGVRNYSSTFRSNGLSASKGAVVRITANRLSFPPDGQRVTDWTLHPVAVGVIDLEGPPRNSRLRLLGIYRLEGDTLTLCVADQGAARPTQFVGSRSHNLVVLKRQR
jgi:uncharacterized protein (TIGR03067 family)